MNNNFEYQNLKKKKGLLSLKVEFKKTLAMLLRVLKKKKKKLLAKACRIINIKTFSSLKRAIEPLIFLSF